MEACIKCQMNQQKIIKEEIKEFLKDPDNFYVKFNPITGYYKFEMIK